MRGGVVGHLKNIGYYRGEKNMNCPNCCSSQTVVDHYFAMDPIFICANCKKTFSVIESIMAR